MDIKSEFRKLLLEQSGNFGYHVGRLKDKSEFIGDKAFAGRDLAMQGIGKPSRTGHFGAGHFFFGDIEKAKEYRGVKDRPIFKVDFSKYNMFRPKDPKSFVEGVIGLTHSLILVPEDYPEEPEYEQLIKDLTGDLSHFGINLSEDQVDKITKGFIHDVATKSNPKSDYLITRLLKAAGYEGIDLRNTPYDSFFIGSVIYDLKDGTIYKA